MANKTGFLDRIARAPLVFDGAMGTMIYERGVFINACYDELCLARPELILTIHQEYVEAGADVIESNTFGANRMKLAAFGLADKVEAINRAVDAHVTSRLRRWLCEKHKVSSGGYSRYSDRYLTERFGLVRLPLLPRRYPRANA